jgi:hypothetical protein
MKELNDGMTDECMDVRVDEGTYAWNDRRMHGSTNE